MFSPVQEIFLCQVRQDFSFPFLQQKTKLPSSCIPTHPFSLVQEKSKKKMCSSPKYPKITCWLHKQVVQLPGPTTTEERQAPGMKDNQYKLGSEPEQTTPSGITLATKQKHTIEQFEKG